MGGLHSGICIWLSYIPCIQPCWTSLCAEHSGDLVIFLLDPASSFFTTVGFCIEKNERINHKLYLKCAIYSIMFLGICHCFLNAFIILSFYDFYSSVDSSLTKKQKTTLHMNSFSGNINPYLSA